MGFAGEIKEYRLEDVCDVFTDGDWIESKDQSEDGIRLIQTGNIGNGYYLDKGERAKFVSYETFERLNCTEIYPGDVLISRLPDPVGRACIIPDVQGRMITAVDCTICRVNTAVVDNRYFRYFCRSEKYYQQLGNSVTGTTRKRISRKNLGNVLIDVPPMEIQLSVIEKLDRVSLLIEKRKKQLDQLDILIKARFVELFGIYPNNEKGWKTGTIRDIVNDVRYGSSRPAVDGGKYPYLRMNNITYGGELDLSDVKQIDVPEEELPKCTVQRGDVLFNRTNSKELVGKTCVYNRDELMVLAGFVIRVRVNDLVLPEFLSAFLNTDFSKQMLLGKCKTAIGQANINAQEMQDIGLYLPPIELQQQFVNFKAQVDKSKFLRYKLAV